MTSVWCVRSGGGMFAENFLNGGFVGIGWREISEDLGPLKTREQLFGVVRRYFPDIQSGVLLSNYVNEIHRFLFEIKPGDYLIIPSSDTDVLNYGVVDEGPVYYDPTVEDGCPLRHRRPVTWSSEAIRLGQFSPAFRDSIRTLLAVPAHTRMLSLLTVFLVEHEDEFIQAIGRPPAAAVRTRRFTREESHRLVLEQVLGLTPPEFERLVAHLLDALGFEDADLSEGHGPRMDVVDARGSMRLPLPARIQVHARFHRGNLGAHLGAGAVRELRQDIPFGSHGVFVSTADFQPEAAAAAREEGFPRISLVSGDQLAELIIQRWSRLPEEVRDRLSLEEGLLRR
jgi:restriction system protein